MRGLVDEVIFFNAKDAQGNKVTQRFLYIGLVLNLLSPLPHPPPRGEGWVRGQNQAEKFMSYFTRDGHRK